MWGQSWPRAGLPAGASPLESRDTSAVLAILIAESDAELYVRAIENAGACRISAACYLEAALVIDNRADALASCEFGLFFRRAGIALEPVTFEQAQLARHACRDFGRGRHPPGLNFGDCLSCALAQCLDEPLLFEGADFTLGTDDKQVISTFTAPSWRWQRDARWKAGAHCFGASTQGGRSSLTAPVG